MIGNKAPDIIVPWFVCTHCNNAGPLNKCPRTPQLGPMCPRCDYCVQVFNPKYSEDHDKRIRAEVLATVLSKMDGPKMSHDDLYRAIQKLQPAAKALEELLRKELEKGWDMGIVMSQNKLAYMLCLLPNEARPARKQLAAAIGVVKALRKEKARAVKREKA